MSGQWVDVTELGSAYEVQLDTSTGALRHRERRCFWEGRDGQAEAPWAHGPAPDRGGERTEDD